MLLGIIDAIWGGTNIPLKPGSTVDLGGVVSMPQVVGTNIDYSNKMTESTVTLKVAVKKGMSITGTFPSGVQQELQIQCDTGQSFTWPDAFRSDKIKLTTGEDAEAEVTLNAGTPTELVA